MAKTAAVTAPDNNWRAESDAYTLAQAEEIKNDTTRLTGAKKVANRLANESAEKTANLRKIAGKKVVKKRKVTKKTKVDDSFYTGR